jgi:hypothetical protein
MEMTTPSQPRPACAGRPAAGFFIAILAALLLAACDSPSNTIQEIRHNLDTFKKTPNMLTLERLDASFDKIDEQIREFEAKGDTVQADLFRRQARTMRDEYRATRMAFIEWAQKQAPEAFATPAVSPEPSEE